VDYEVGLELLPQPAAAGVRLARSLRQLGDDAYAMASSRGQIGLCGGRLTEQRQLDAALSHGSAWPRSPAVSS
jgi:hypothetical protein